jgi:hypothetical protein
MGSKSSSSADFHHAYTAVHGVLEIRITQTTVELLMRTITRCVGLGAGLLSPLVVGCAGTSEEPGTLASELRYERASSSCEVKGTQEDIDTPATNLPNTIVLKKEYTFAEEEPAAGVQLNYPWKLFRLFRATPWTEETRAWSGQPAPLGFTISGLLVEQNQKLKFLDLQPQETRLFAVTWGTGSGTSGSNPLSSIFLNDPTVEPDGQLPAHVSINRGGAGSLTLNLTQAQTIALVRHLGARGLTSPNLPAAKFELSTPRQSCSTKQLHLPPNEDNGLSFHITLCCPE